MEWDHPSPLSRSIPREETGSRQAGVCRTIRDSVNEYYVRFNLRLVL